MGLAAFLVTVLPSSGPLVGQNVVTITGIRLGAGTDIQSVRFGTVVQSLLSQTDTTAVVLVAAAPSPGPLNVQVTSTLQGLVSNSLYYTYNIGMRPPALKVSWLVASLLYSARVRCSGLTQRDVERGE